MAASKEELQDNKVRLHIQVPASTFQESIDKVYRKERPKYAMVGFRKGKVPRPVLEAKYGDNIFYQSAFDDLFENAVLDAIKETEVAFVGLDNKSLHVNEIGRNLGVDFTVDVWIRPTVTLSNYEGLKAIRSVRTVTDAEIDSVIERARTQNARWVSKDRAAQTGDRVVIDYVGNIDGVPIDGGSDKGAKVHLGSHTFLDEMEDQLVGAMPGQDVQVHVTFPEDYPTEQLRGKEADFDIHVSDVLEEELPPLDDELAGDIAGLATLEELREQLRKSIQAEFDTAAESKVEAELLSQVCENAQVDIPPTMIEDAITEKITELELNLRVRGGSLQWFMQQSGLTQEALRERYRSEAHKQVKEQLVLGALLADMQLVPDPKNIDDYLTKAAENMDKTLEEFKDGLPEEQYGVVANQIALAMLLQNLKDKADITEVPADVTEDALQEIAVREGLADPDTLEETAIDEETTQPGEAQATSEITEEAAPQESAQAEAESTSEVTQEAAPQESAQAEAESTSEVTQEAAPQESAQAEAESTSEITQEAAPQEQAQPAQAEAESTSEVTQEATPQEQAQPAQAEAESTSEVTQEATPDEQAQSAGESATQTEQTLQEGSEANGPHENETTQQTPTE